MNCDEAEELLGAYALDALPADEAAEFRAHLVGCERHAARAEELLGVATRMAALANAAQPPERLRARVVDAIARAGAATAVLDPGRDGAPAGRAPLDFPGTARAGTTAVATERRGATKVLRFPAWAVGAASAVVFVAIAGLIAWNVALMSQVDDDDPAMFASRITSVTALQPADGAPAGASGYILYADGEAQAVIVGEGMPDLGESQTYQLWAVTSDGDASSLGLMEADDDGRSRALVPFDADESDIIAVTIEPPGGSDQPSTAPVFSARVAGS
jgi:anti-sigma-K factor RskA